MREKERLSVVVIGRNQGDRLKECLRSVQRALIKEEYELLYIDTASTDNSMAVARSMGVAALSIDPPRPSAAIARNVGWKLVQNPFVLLLDADTRLATNFIEKAFPFFSNPQVAIVCGQRRERNPEASIYQRVLDIDWGLPTGEVLYCGGDALIRRSALKQVGGYDGSLIAGEEPELCYRLRAQGKKIIRLEVLMTLHDLDMKRFSQYWKRCFRTGYAYAEVSEKCGRTPPGPLWKEESRHNLWKGSCMLLLPLVAVVALPWTLWPLLSIIALAAAVASRTALKIRKKNRSWTTCILYGLHAHFQHIPMFFGQINHLLPQRSAQAKHQ